MSMVIYLNGELLRREDGRISPFDRGFLFGDGLFETMRVYDGRAHVLERHLRRLYESARFLAIPLPPREALIDAVRATIDANGARDAALRLTVTRGVGSGLFDISGSSSPTILIALRPLLQIGGNDGDYGIDASGNEGAIADAIESEGDESEGSGDGKNRSDEMETRREESERRDDEMNRSNALAAPVWRGAERVITLSARHMLPEIGRRLKALSYLTAIYSARELAAAGVREGILRTPDGVVAEGSVSNLFALANDVLYTPPLELGVLAGITRKRVIELAREQGLEVRECAFDLEFFKRSDECFYTNSLRELVPIAAVDSSTIGSGASGPITMMLLDAYRREAPDEWI